MNNKYPAITKIVAMINLRLDINMALKEGSISNSFSATLRLHELIFSVNGLVKDLFV